MLCVAANAGEMISELTVAIQFKVGLGAMGMGSVIHSYPTVSDSVGGAAHQFKAMNWKYRDTDGTIKGGE